MKMMCGAVVLAVLATSPTSYAAVPQAVPQPSDIAIQKPISVIAPLVDYHQHLLSPAAAELINRPKSAPNLPPELSRLLQDVAQHWNSPDALGDLYTEESLILRTYDPVWIKGRAAVTKYVGTIFGRSYRLTPLAFEMSQDGKQANLSGYFTRGEGSDTSYFGNFYLSVLKGTDGKWRIAVETPFFSGPTMEAVVTADDLIRHMDEAGIGRAVVLSVAYFFGNPSYNAGPNEYALTKAENDWTAEQVARYPGRLVAFCSFNPLRDYALPELERCAKSGKFKGLKLHFGGSHIDLKNPGHVAKLEKVFAAANKYRLPITVHVRADQTYGREQAEVFVRKLVAAAPDVPIQIAHLWGGEAYSDAALKVYADAVRDHDPITRNLYFDVAESVEAGGGTDEALRMLAQRIREIGVERILYGSDALGNRWPKEAWETFREKMPLADAEFRTIASHVQPYLR